MTYYECEDCGQMADFVDAHGSAIRRECPSCHHLTVWTPAFTDERAGVSF